MLWSDEPAASSPDRRVVRRFSASFIADLLADLGAVAAVCLGSTPGPPGALDAAMAASGIEAQADLDLDPARPAFLHALDRLRTLAGAAPGAVAVHGGGGDWSRAEAHVVAAHLVGRHGFCAGAAGAWLALACPWLPAMADSDGEHGRCRGCSSD